ncbi:MAG TPA: anti-sigma factor [Candidatus Angelobacter sp.]|nr:anti-sigma factor [Candidatus Angelobacter sp.]
MKDHAQYADSLAIYAMNALDDDQELAELRQHLASCAECRGELEALRGDMALLALSTAGPKPPQRSRERLMHAVAAEPRHTQKVKTHFVLGRLQPRWLTLAPTVVAVLVLLASVALVRENLRLRTTREKLAQELQVEQERAALAEEVMQMMHDPSLPRMTLVSAKSSPQPQVKTIYQPQRGHILLMANNLPQLPDDKVYELWLMPSSGGAPMPAGTFSPDQKGGALMLHAMEDGGVEARAFAVTIEPRGGSRTPTMPIQFAPAG